MAGVRWILIAGMSIFAGVVFAEHFGLLSLGAAGQVETLYQCSMHPTYTSDKPGECPICGMTLVPVKPAAAEPATSSTDGSSEVLSSPVPGLASVQIPAARVQLIGVRDSVAERRQLSERLDLVGYVVPDETRVAHVHTRLSGWLEHMEVDETGQKVKKGDPLFTLFSRELYQAEREFLLARKSSAAGGAVAQNTMAEVSNAARRRLELLDVPSDEIARLEKTGQPEEALLFRSPLAGYVLRKDALEGKYVTPGTELYTVADLSRVWVLAEVYERNLAHVQVGQSASLSVDALPGRDFDGKVAFVYPVLSPKTRTLRVRLEFDNPELALRPGMYGKVRVQTRSREALSVPDEAVVDAGQHQYLFVLHEGGHFEPRLVRPGQRSGGFVEILSGVSAGERVVTSSGFFIDSESRLKAAIEGLGAPAAGEHAGHGP